MKKEMKLFLFGVFASVLLFLAACGAEEAPETTEEQEEVAEETIEVVVEETTEIPAEVAPETEETEVETTEETVEEIPVEETTDYETISVEGCNDTDNGKNYEVYGTIVDSHGTTDADRCSTNENYPGRLYESYCQEDGYHGRETYDCPSGSCVSGACVAVEETESMEE